MALSPHPAIRQQQSRQTTLAGINVATHTPARPSGSNCLGPQTTTSHHNGHGQRFLRTTPQGQSVYLYGTDQYTVLAETHQASALTTSNAETVYLPAASGPMPVVALINSETSAAYADHLNTSRRLTDAQGRPRWQWAFSGFGERAAQSIPRANLHTIQYSLRYLGPVDDGNSLFYNGNQFYDPLAGRYTQADPIGLYGGTGLGPWGESAVLYRPTGAAKWSVKAF